MSNSELVSNYKLKKFEGLRQSKCFALNPINFLNYKLESKSLTNVFTLEPHLTFYIKFIIGIGKIVYTPF